MNFNDFQLKYQKTEVFEYPNNVLIKIPSPALSVIVITYQHINYIKDAIEGVLMQKTDFPFEIIIGDDDSTDGTREVCIEYAKKYPDKIRLFLHKRENNIKILGKFCLIFQYIYNCFQLRGKYITGVSGDDYWTDPTKLQKQYDFLKNHPDFTMCYHKWIIINENDKQTSNCITGTTPRALSLMYLNIFKDIPYQFTEVLAEDTFTKFILSTLGKKKYLDTIKASVYREHSESLWSSGTVIFKHDNDVLSATKIAEAYKGTQYQPKLDALLFARIVLRKIFLLGDIHKNTFSFILSILQEIFKHKLSYQFPFKLEYAKYPLNVRFFIALIFIILNNLKWKFKYYFKI